MLGNADKGSEQLIHAIEHAHRSTDRPVVVVWTGGSGRPRQRLRELGIPCYTDPGRAADAIAALAEHSLRPPLPQPVRPDDIDQQVAGAVVREARARGRAQLDEHESSRLIAAYGITCAGALPAADAGSAVDAAERLGGPVAVKLLSAGIGHKSDIGGVRLGLSEGAEIRTAADDLLRIARDAGEPEPRVLVQRMSSGGAELIAGIKHDPAFGPVVVVGFGGVLVDVLADSQVGIAPLDTASARRLLLALRGAALFDGVRGAPPLDLDAAADVVARLSWLAEDLGSEIAELDVNPLLVSDSGAVAVDCLAMLSDG